MHQGLLGGRIGPFLDPASQQQVQGQVQGRFSFQTQADPNAVLPQLRARLLHGINSVLGQKLAQNQVAIPTIPHSLPHFIPEIIAASGAQAHGVNVTALELQVSMENPSAVQQYTGPLPPDPMQAAKNAYVDAAKERLDPRNYDYVAKVNIGGFKLKASTDEGFDADGLKDQVKDKVKTEIIWYGIGCVVVGIVGIGLLGLGWYVYSQYQAGNTSGGTRSAAGASKSVAWDGKTPLSCSGNDSVKVEDVTASIASGSAVKASANCTLELVNVNITAPTGIEALANAKVTVKGGSVTSTSFAAKALGNAQITFSGTTVSGKTQALGAAKISGL